MPNVKQRCARCGGSGAFSFNLIHGTKCYGCNGAGFVVVDAAKAARSEKAKAKRAAVTAAGRALRESLAATVRAELDAAFGPFEDSERGAYERVMRCQVEYGKTPGAIVQERMQRAAASSQAPETALHPV